MTSRCSPRSFAVAGVMHRVRSTSCLLVCAMVLSACGGGSNVRPQPVPACPKVPPYPAEILEPVEPDLLKRMRELLLESPETGTTPSASSQPVRPS